MALATLLGACETIHFYAQATAGQIGILSRRESTHHLIDAADTNPELRARLLEVGNILAFARERLLLPTKGQFSSYVHVNGQYLVWNVFATREFSTEATQWCYPIIGCASYRGYFSKRDARRFARRLSAAQHDVAVGGVVAYSTLGWFDDPLVSTYIDWPPAELAGLLFHELTHAKFFVKGDTPFNEGLATFVEREGVREWLASRGEASEIQRLELRWSRSDQLVRFMLAWRLQLAKLYDQPFNDTARRLLKGDMMVEIDRCMRINAEMLGQSATSDLLRIPMNNARLVPFAAYHEDVAGFAALFDACGRNWLTFFARVEALGREKPAQRTATMSELGGSAGVAPQTDSAAAVHCQTLTYEEAS
jgi:predicted aminopeptidase